MALAQGFRHSSLIGLGSVENQSITVRDHVTEQNSSCPNQRVQVKNMCFDHHLLEKAHQDLKTPHVQKAVLCPNPATLRTKPLGGHIHSGSYFGYT